MNVIFDEEHTIARFPASQRGGTVHSFFTKILLSLGVVRDERNATKMLLGIAILLLLSSLLIVLFFVTERPVDKKYIFNPDIDNAVNN